MAQAHIQTRRLSLEPLSIEHREELHQLDTDPDVMRYIFTGKPLSDEESGMVFDHLLHSSQNEGLGCWVGKDGDDFVGWWVLAPAETKDKDGNTVTDPDRVELGMRVAPEYWGQGYAKEGLQAMLKYCIEDVGAQQVFGETMAVNAGSRATMAKCGLKHVRTWHNTYEDFTPAPGIEHGEVEYRVTKEEWLRRSSTDSQKSVDEPVDH